MEDRNNKETGEDQLLYIMVVGFHHKKGCQLEYVYPSGGENDKRIRRITTVDSSSEGELYKLPKRWRHLPSLALPDGSHNYTTDYIYFHLEDDEDEEADEEVVENESSRNNSGSVDESAKQQKGKRLSPRQTIFGVSCYRQINASELIIKEVDVTRNTLQKSVCILSREPVYASLRLKLQSITSAYFEQKDFRRTSILATAFESLRKTYRTRAPRRAVGAPQSLVSQQRLISSPAFPTMPRSGGHVIEDDSEQRSRYLTGLSLGELVLRYQHKTLVLFKLMLLQKKCLFQIKPVSNLSNTIMALVSLMPDIFLPSSATSSDAKVSGLHSAAGFFDSLDLINSELERKNLKRRKAAAAAAENRTSTDLEANISLAKLKKNKKKFMSFSKRKQQHYQQQLRKQQQQQQQQQYQNGATNSTASISSSYSSHSLKSPPQLKPIDPSVPQSPTSTTATTATTASPSLFNMISQNTQKFFSFQTATNQSGPVTNTTNLAGSDSDLYNKLSNEDEDDVDVVKSKQQLQLHLNHDQDDVESDFVLTAANGDDESKQPTATIESPVGTVGELLKSRMSDVFKLVDWSSPIVHTATTTSSSKQFSTPSPPTNQQESSSTSPSTTTSSSANNSSMRRSESSSISSSKTATNTNPGGVQTTPSSTGSRHRQEGGGVGGGEIQLAELLDHEMGMPLPLFDEFNVLHPYLSLYYLDYFTAINKMNTKLFCTTTLMMSMLTQNSQKSREEQQGGEEVVDTESGTSVPPAAPFDPTRPRQTDVNCPLGYTIGATNALFKQRLYDDIDAFVDEVDVDLKVNETLKKQLQLSTADLRFTDYIIKNVQANREKQQQQSQSSAKLISIKKTSSSNTFNPNKSSSEYNIDEENSPSSPNSSPTMTTVEFEGSDDWIRLNFKWYLYTMLASIVREEACARLKLELENLIFSSAAASFSSSSSSAASSASHSGGDNYSSAGSTSLENEVVNIDDYIDRVTNTTKTPSNGSPVVRRVARRGSEKNKGDPNTTTPTKFDTTTPRKKKHGSKKELSSRKNSSSSSSNGSLSSIHYYNLIQQINTYSNYREDFNSHFVSEFKRTECYRRWQETNKSRIEKTLFNFTPTATATTTTAPIAPTASVSSTSLTTNATFQWTLTQLQEIDNRRVTHPFNGQLGVNDIRLRFSFLFANSESGRKLNRALEEGGRLVNSTGKAVGSVLNSAKSTFSSLISNWSNSTANTNSYSSSSPSSPSSASSKSKSNTKM